MSATPYLTFTNFKKSIQFSKNCQVRLSTSDINDDSFLYLVSVILKSETLYNNYFREFSRILEQFSEMISLNAKVAAVEHLVNSSVPYMNDEKHIEYSMWEIVLNAIIKADERSVVKKSLKENLLRKCINLGLTNLIKLLLERCDMSTEVVDLNEMLCEAISMGRLGAVTLLIEDKNVDLNYKSSLPLRLALRNGHRNIAELLMAKEND